MIAFVQPFGLNGAGGGARILRSLWSGAPLRCLSIATCPYYSPSSAHPDEVHLPLRPYFGRIESTRFVSYVGIPHLDRLLREGFKSRLKKLCIERGVEAIHAIPHGLDFWYAYEVARDLGIPYYISVHDDMTYNLQRAPYLAFAMEKLGKVWREADGVTVISPQMGEEYARRYGDRPYAIVTDGLESIAESPRERRVNSLRVYMMGLIHLTYEETFRVFFESLNHISEHNPDWNISFTSRGGLSFSVDRGRIPIDVLPWGTQDDIEADLTRADVLYLPLPIEPRFDSFTRYSLSTKLITYLGSGIPILYHGPDDSAAALLLNQHDAAICSSSTEPRMLARTIISGLERSELVAANALELARSQFMLRDQLDIFWGLVKSSSARQEVAKPVV